MLNSLTSAQLSEWEAYDRIDPVGILDSRLELSLANLMALIANVNRDTKKKPKPFTPADFMPRWDKSTEVEVRPQQTVEEQKAIMFGIIKDIKNRKKK